MASLPPVFALEKHSPRCCWSDYFIVKITCPCASFTLLQSSAQLSQDRPSCGLPRAPSLVASSLKLATALNDSLQLPEQGKLLFVCLLACVVLLTSFCFLSFLPLHLCSYCSLPWGCPTYPPLITLRRRVPSESAFYPQHLT